MNKGGEIRKAPENSSLMDDFMGVKPRNREQIFALDLLTNDDIPLVSLTGIAGSGKTFISALLREYLPKRTYIFTPTGRAAKVIKSMIKDKYKRNNVSTIHHGIYTWDHDWTQYSEDKEEIPENVEKVKTYFRLGSNKDASDTIYICDESSMISFTGVNSNFI